MKEWLTAREIAAETLPDMPTTESAVIRYAEREIWDTHVTYARKRRGRGGGMEYHYRLLPTLAQVAYVQRHMTIGAEPVEVATVANPHEPLTRNAETERDARLAILTAYALFSRGLRLNQQACVQIFCDRYEMGSILVDGWVKAKVPTIGRRTLLRWMAEKRVGNINALAFDRSKARAGSGLLDTASDGAVKAFVLAWIAANPALSAEIIRGYVELEFGAQLVNRDGEMKALPPVRTFQHFIKALKAAEKVVLTKITNPDKYRSTLKLRGTGSYSWVNEPNQLWMIDASPGDALLLDGRHSIYVCIDVATRWLTMTVSKTPRASAVNMMMRKAVLRCGVCKAVKTDNGSDFVAEEAQRLLRSLEIETVRSQKYTPEEKAFVERAIKTVQHNFFSQLPGYIGHNVAERKAIEDRKSFAQRLGEGDLETFSVSLTAAQLQEKLDDWLEYYYHQHEHAGLCDRSPADVLASSMAPIARVNERALDVLLMPVAGKDGMRRMTPQGIKIQDNYYLTGSILPGTDVFVRLDPLDMGKVYAFSAKDGSFLDTAICPKLSDVNPAAFVKATKQQFNQMVSEREREIRKDVRKLLKGPSGIDRTIELAKRKSAERAEASANIIALPKREELHTSSQLEAALDAVSRSEPAKMAARVADLHAEVLADLKPQAASANVQPIRTSPTPAQRFRRWLDIETRMRAGQPVEAAEAHWAGSYQTSSEFKTQKAMFDDFGDQAPGLRT
ncbi:DDE-type integrase/transposase/recombinase (plasmid) [Rhizobium lusitanum]|uniref:DDE-type integrase/transposase/recombinase n=1 Tax=Rhizobium lusitanum TaxID=293958 RepID=UPI00160CC599|nr:DDE-type integrase/transposase/recombinase [Rhizobium lusitanum]QND45336.1 DDE-type integrase/transposase/recombinase [Rhizobium lusitanum]